MCKCPSRSCFLFIFLLCTLLNKSPEMELLDHMVILFVALEVQQSIPFTIIAAPCFFFFLAARGLLCCACAFSSCGEQGLLFFVEHGLLTSTGFRSVGSVVVVHRLSCSAACGVFPDQRSNPCLLHWQVDSFLLSNQAYNTHNLL